jgi:hypothetical protein
MDLLYFGDKFLIFVGMRRSKCLIFLLDSFELWHEVADVLGDFLTFFLKFFGVALILLVLLFILSYFCLSSMLYFF